MTGDEKAKFFAYLRVSTSKQEKEGTIENQRLSITNYLKGHLDIEIIAWFLDDGVSAFKNRAGYNEMMSRLDETNGVIINSLSRIGRSAKDLINILDIFKQKNILFISIKDNIDTSSSIGKLMYTVFAGFQEYEAELIRERMRDGVIRARMEDKEKGVNRFGRPRVKFTDADLKEMKRQYQNGDGIHRIRRYFDKIKGKKCSASTIRRRLIEMGVQMRELND